MHVNYPEKHPQRHWDTLNLDYPVKLISTNQLNISSETIARKWRPQPETLQEKSVSVKKKVIFKGYVVFHSKSIFSVKTRSSAPFYKILALWWVEI